jgi:hypothetical protein
VEQNQPLDPAFERAFVAASYWMGVRDDALEGWPLGSEARALARTLVSGDREARALVLAREVARIAVALEKGALG